MKSKNKHHRLVMADLGVLVDGAIVAVYKPSGPTSHDIIDQLRKITGIKKIGHAGTLDPLASGVLVVGIGRSATRQLGDIVQKDKEYKATIRLGITSSTDDEEGVKSQKEVVEKPTPSDIEKVVKKFCGSIQQTPPRYSAIKIKGQPAHRRVRRGENVDIKPRQVFIKNIELLQYHWPILELIVQCGPGVYIRSLARDIGEVLGVGGYLAALERVRVGSFCKEEAIHINDIS